MSAFETATKFFHACETLQGWPGCKDYVVAGAPFSAQSEPLTDIQSVEAYCEWMAGLGKGPLEGCEYELHSSSYDEASKNGHFFRNVYSHPRRRRRSRPTYAAADHNGICIPVDDEPRRQGRKNVQNLERTLGLEGAWLGLKMNVAALVVSTLAPYFGVGSGTLA